MLRKAKETKRQIIESLNKRLLEQKPMPPNFNNLNPDGRFQKEIESIVTKKHQEMVTEIKKFVDPIMRDSMEDGKMSKQLDIYVANHEKGLVQQIMKAIKEDSVGKDGKTIRGYKDNK
tara:strand:- start:51 stop:404 length:354 start_codon:yes stop_codon:yes gene_type:complete